MGNETTQAQAGGGGMSRLSFGLAILLASSLKTRLTISRMRHF
jgi:hypothetical protein